MLGYGLSGSGKTFTLFGPDDPAVPEAWYKSSQPHDLWGIFPRLAYDLFEMSDKTCKFSMKYFQNIIDKVRDLLSPSGEEKSYKLAMPKDAEGFMDIGNVVGLKSWDELCNTFMKADARKAVSPTQFHHQYTRGHCILNLEVDKPNDNDQQLRQRGRIYICDLAGTEPAGHIYHAYYKKIKHPNGTIEHKLLGPHKDQRLTKTLQSQGKKINLSLSELAQLFKKTAQALKKGKLKPGETVPGCNSSFLCKFLKGTIWKSQTYFVCAIRPEASYLNYTFPSLVVCKNAAAIQSGATKTTKPVRFNFAQVNRIFYVLWPGSLAVQIFSSTLNLTVIPYFCSLERLREPLA